MKILVTGSEGYIGVRLVERLTLANHTVTGLDTGFYRRGWLYGDHFEERPTIRKDIRHVELDDLNRFEAVIHLAELSNDPLGQFNPDITHEINHLGSLSLAEKCKIAGVKHFVYASSCSVYGIGTGDDIKTEQSPIQPQTTYAQCKALVEENVSHLADDNFSPTFLRFATAYGPSPRMRFDIVVNNLAGMAWTKKRIHLTSDGTPWRPLIHIEDFCDAFRYVLEAPRGMVHDQVFNVGSTPENFQIRQISEMVAEVFQGCEVTIGKSDPDNRSYRVLFKKIHNNLPGFKIRWTLQKGIKELHNLFASIEMTEELFLNSSYTRLAELKHLIEAGELEEHLYWRR